MVDFASLKKKQQEHCKLLKLGDQQVEQLVLLVLEYKLSKCMNISRAEGSSKRRSLGAGIASGLGGLIGGGIGSGVGSVLGLPGAVAGGVAGYGAGTELASKAYKAVTGDPGKKLTSQGALENIKKSIPPSIKSKIPTSAKKSFTDFYKQAVGTVNKVRQSYDAYQKGKEMVK